MARLISACTPPGCPTISFVSALKRSKRTKGVQLAEQRIHQSKPGSRLACCGKSNLRGLRLPGFLRLLGDHVRVGFAAAPRTTSRVMRDVKGPGRWALEDVVDDCSLVDLSWKAPWLR